ncbi:Hypothetical protein A7982_05629 [Minicystis rosea]|nr:Hypothetical protein A7982_05629 [Minicystis rosea]
MGAGIPHNRQLMEVFMHKQFTEPIFSQLSVYRDRLVEHPLLTAARGGELPVPILHELAFHQFSDSILWIPMLAQMKSKTHRSRRLRRAIEDNIAHEAGLNGDPTAHPSHVTLAVEMMRSLGLRATPEFPREAFDRSATHWLSDDFARFGEPEIAGWLLTAETLVPLFFEAIVPGFDTLGSDTRYFHEHIHIDADEHATWMAEAVGDVVDLYGPSAIPAIIVGMREAWEDTIEVPDELWKRAQAPSLSVPVHRRA